MASWNAAAGSAPLATAANASAVSSGSSKSSTWNCTISTASGSNPACSSRNSRKVVSIASPSVTFTTTPGVPLSRRCTRPKATPPAAERADSVVSDTARPLRLIEVACDQRAKFDNRELGVIASNRDLQPASFGDPQRHQPHNTLGIHPLAAVIAPDQNAGAKLFGKPGEPDRRPGVQACGRGNHHRDLQFLASAQGRILSQRRNSSAAFLTCSRSAPEAASAAATMAPSTRGALQIVTRPRRSGGTRSTAISELVSAPPRSTNTATPASDQTDSRAR